MDQMAGTVTLVMDNVGEGRYVCTKYDIHTSGGAVFCHGCRKEAEGKQLSDARIYDWEFSHNIFCANCEAKYIIYNC
jgi:hypothetical protein